MGVNPNPNPSGGTDNPGGSTAIAGGPSNPAATETAPLTFSGASLTASAPRAPSLPPGIAAGGSDTALELELVNDPYAGGGDDLIQTKTVTVPHDWILQNAASESLFELIPNTPGIGIFVVAVFGHLKFGTTPYTGSLDSVPNLAFCTSVSNNPSGGYVQPRPESLWGATADAIFAFTIAGGGASWPSQPDLPAVGLFIDGVGLSDGDSDLDIILYYISQSI